MVHIGYDDMNNHTTESDDANRNTLSDATGPDRDKNKDEEVLVEVGELDLFDYEVYENANICLSFAVAMQHVLMSLSRSLSTSLLVADIICARSDENYKARLLSTTMFISGITTLLQNTIGIRLPLYQGPAATYVVPLLAMSALPEWKCPDFSQSAGNTTSAIQEQKDTTILHNTRRVEGSLMIAGAAHMLMGLCGGVGFLLRFIGPVTVLPALTITALYVYKATVSFAKVQWGVAFLTTGMAYFLSFFLRGHDTPVPAYNRARGLYIRWYPLHKMFSFGPPGYDTGALITFILGTISSIIDSIGDYYACSKILIACLAGWAVSAILTAVGAFSEDPTNDQYFARTDSRLGVVRDTDWFIFPYPGQFGPTGYDTGALITFILGTISSIIDSIGDYYACSKVCEAPPPPPHAVNRGIAVEGLMSFLGGWSGAGHATSTFGGNIGAISITRVASLRVFQCVGVIFITFGVIGKVGAIFVTIPYSVIGGMMMVNFGVLVGVVLSNLQFFDMNSTRNMAFIGVSMLISLMLPHWIGTSKNAIDLGNETVDSVIRMFLVNPAFLAGVLACTMDNIIPGTDKERGLLAWTADMGQDESEQGQEVTSQEEKDRKQRVLECVYKVPYSDQLLKRFPKLRYIPVYPR